MPPKKDAAPEETVYRLRLKADVEGQVASFQIGDRAIELTADSPVFETTNRQEYAGARDLPFLEDAD